MPRYYCDCCDTYLTHDSPSVRKQHNAGYKHKANVRDYYLQYEAQQNQFLIDQRVKAHLGQTAAYQQVGAAYNQMTPCLPVFPAPMMPLMHGNMHLLVNSPLLPGMRPLVLPRQGYVSALGMPPMAAPPGAPSLPGQVDGQMPMVMNPPPLVPGSTPASSGAPPMFTPAMYQANPAAPTTGGLDDSNTNTQTLASDAKH